MKSNKRNIFLCAVFLSSLLALPSKAANSDFTVTNGVLTKYTGTETNVIIPNDMGIASIGDSAFYGNHALTSVMLPDGLQSIGQRAFEDCDGLCSLSIPDSVTAIGAYAFSDCYCLSSVAIPDSISSMGDGVFLRSKLTKPIIVNKGKILCFVPASYTQYVIPDTVTEIAGEAFGPFSQITSVTIPEGVTSIGAGAFDICSNLTSVSIPDSVIQIGAGAFSRDSRLAAVNIPNGVKTIDDYTFTDCFSLTSIVIPNSVTSIGEIAFACCNLASVSLPKNLNSIGSGAFNGNAGLSSIIIPKSVVSIGKDAFNGEQNIIIYGEDGSFAQQYAKGNSLKFISAEIAEPTQYSLMVNGRSQSLCAYNIEGVAYFKLRDIALALSGTEKQFEVFWDGESNQIALSTGKTYTPAGGELSKPTNLNCSAASAGCSEIYLDALPIAGRVFNVNGNNFMTLSNLAAALKLTYKIDETNHSASMSSVFDSSSAGFSGKVVDNIARASSGCTYSIGEGATVNIVYNNETKASVRLNKNGANSDGIFEAETGFYLSQEKTAIAYGGGKTDVYVAVSDDMGKTWNTYKLDGTEDMCGGKILSFDTVNDGWLSVNDGAGMGTSRNYLFVTHDGGKTWTQIGNPNYIYSRILTGMGFSNNRIGFMCYRYDFADFNPAICWTQDGGLTWEKLYITLPKEFDGYNKTPLSPLFNGADGRLPIQLSDNSGYIKTIYLDSSDYGMTWSYNGE